MDDYYNNQVNFLSKTLNHNMNYVTHFLVVQIKSQKISNRIYLSLFLELLKKQFLTVMLKKEKLLKLLLLELNKELEEMMVVISNLMTMHVY